MKKFKALFIHNGIIKAGEFPVEPDSCFLPFCETDGTDIEYCKCHELEMEYERAMRDAKANAVECEDQEEALGLAFITCPSDAILLRGTLVVGVQDGIYPLPSGWDYVEKVRVCTDDCTCAEPCIVRVVAKLYRTDPLQQLAEQQEDIDPEISTIVEKRFMDMVGSQEQPEPEESQRDMWNTVLQIIAPPGTHADYLDKLKRLNQLFTLTRRK